MSHWRPIALDIAVSGKTMLNNFNNSDPGIKSVPRINIIISSEKIFPMNINKKPIQEMKPKYPFANNFVVDLFLILSDEIKGKKAWLMDQKVY